MYTTSIRDFKKEKVIGKGSFGSVYLVRRRQDNKIYALKSVILEKLSKKEQENSVNEVRILASVNHPNVIGYKEAFWDDEKSALNIVMEYADDGDLHSKIEKMKKAGGYFKEPIIWSYAIQMIEGLKALHDKKIMHRDLKSANIFLVKNKHQCKLGDMNVSKVIKEKVLHTQTGTPYYASPEVWNDAPYSYKSDLWSIGCVIYELCALRPPFQGKDLDELYENVCKGKPERINEVYSDDLWKMIQMLLQVDVNKRVDCNKFLNSDLIKHKMQEIKNDPNFGIDAFIYNKNKDNDDYLLETIKFKDIKEIKAQLPTKKNYNSNLLSGNKIKINKSNKLIEKNNKSNNKSNNNNKDEELLSKKIKEKHLEYEKMKKLLNKNNENKNNIIDISNKENKYSKQKLRKKILINIKESNNEKSSKKNLLKPFKSDVYKKDNNLKSVKKLNNIYIDTKINNPNSGHKSMNIQNTEKENIKKIDIYKLYLKKYAYKINHTNINLCEERCQTPTANYKKIFNNKLSNIPRYEKNKNHLTNVERKKVIKYNEEASEVKKHCNTLEIKNNNSYVYNKPNMISKKNDSLVRDSAHSLTIDNPGSPLPIYKRIHKNNSGSLFSSNSPVSLSFIKKHNKNMEISNFKNKIPMINSPVIINKRKTNEDKEVQNVLNKLNKYFSYDINKFNNENKYIKKINIKSYKQKLKSLQNDNFYEKREKYGRIYEKEEKEKEKNNIKKSGNEILLTNKSNEFMKKVKPINIKEGSQILRCYLSPKNNKSQIFNNFYSINLPAPVKVINVFKK